MVRVEDLKENVLNLKLKNEYVIYKSSRNNKKICLEGVFLGETGLDNRLYLFESYYGFKECFHKIDFVISEYEIEKASKKAKLKWY